MKVLPIGYFQMKYVDALKTVYIEVGCLCISKNKQLSFFESTDTNITNKDVISKMKKNNYLQTHT